MTHIVNVANFEGGSDKSLSEWLSPFAVSIVCIASTTGNICALQALQSFVLTSLRLKRKFSHCSAENLYDSNSRNI